MTREERDVLRAAVRWCDEGGGFGTDEELAQAVAAYKDREYKEQDAVEDSLRTDWAERYERRLRLLMDIADEHAKGESR